MDKDFIIASLVRFGLNFFYALAAIFLGILAFRWLDIYLFKNIDFVEEVKKGNIAAAILSFAILVFIAVVIGFALR